jgi:hypothetical protein
VLAGLTADARSSTAATAPPPTKQRCVRAWNAPTNDRLRRLLQPRAGQRAWVSVSTVITVQTGLTGDVTVKRIECQVTLSRRSRLRTLTAAFSPSRGLAKWASARCFPNRYANARTDGAGHLSVLKLPYPSLGGSCPKR